MLIDRHSSFNKASSDVTVESRQLIEVLFEVMKDCDVCTSKLKLKKMVGILPETPDQQQTGQKTQPQDSNRGIILR